MSPVTLDRRALEQLIVRAPERADAALDEAAQTGVDLALASFGASPEGRVYRRHRSIYVASQPGYPPNVDTGRLRDSWILDFASPTRAMTSTNVTYARFVEDNLRSVRFRNHGPHSVKLTIAGLRSIIAAETARTVPDA